MDLLPEQADQLYSTGNLYLPDASFLAVISLRKIQNGNRPTGAHADEGKRKEGKEKREKGKRGKESIRMK